MAEPIKYEYVKKLSASVIMGTVPKPAKGKTVALYRIVGICSGDVRMVKTKFGDSVGIKGQFKAIRFEDRAGFESGELFLPDIANNIILPQLKGDGAAVEFGFDVYVKGNETPIGYEYGIKTLVAVKESAAMTALMEKGLTASPLPAMAEPTPAATGKK